VERGRAERTQTTLRLDVPAPSAEESLRQVRLKNGIVFAWVRALFATGTLALHALAWSEGLTLPAGRLASHALLALAAVAVVALLTGAGRTPTVLAAGAGVDLLGIALWGWILAAPGPWAEGPVVAAALMVGLIELVVLASAMTLPARFAGGIAGAGIAIHVAASAAAGLRLREIAAVGLALAAFAAVAGWAGLRLARSSARTATDRHAAVLARRKVEEANAARAEAAAERDALIDARNVSEELSAAIVHDLKNPLATLLQYAALAESQLQKDGAAPQVLSDLRLIGDEGRRLAKLIGDLLLVHRLERGGLALRREAVPIALLLERVAEAHRPRARQRGVTVEVACAAGLIASIDPDLSHRLLENLVGNALRHVGEGDRIELAAETCPGGLRLAVRNSGVAVPAEARAKLFEKYATRGRREWHNAGLGLYLCRLVAEAHDGWIRLADRPGWSVSFEATFEVPGGEG
jgi:signal transduction histidine kinase